ncbi:hypothetical protein CTB90_03370 [Dickeya solani]|nr:hypothetical protein CTB90_03370 [Dickeya solani]
MFNELIGARRFSLISLVCVASGVGSVPPASPTPIWVISSCFPSAIAFASLAAPTWVSRAIYFVLITCLIRISDKGTHARVWNRFRHACRYTLFLAISARCGSGGHYADGPAKTRVMGVGTVMAQQREEKAPQNAGKKKPSIKEGERQGWCLWQGKQVTSLHTTLSTTLTTRKNTHYSVLSLLSTIILPLTGQFQILAT